MTNLKKGIHLIKFILRRTKYVMTCNIDRDNYKFAEKVVYAYSKIY